MLLPIPPLIWKTFGPIFHQNKKIKFKPSAAKWLCWGGGVTRLYLTLRLCVCLSWCVQTRRCASVSARKCVRVCMRVSEWVNVCVCVFVCVVCLCVCVCVVCACVCVCVCVVCGLELSAGILSYIQFYPRQTVFSPFWLQQWEEVQRCLSRRCEVKQL